MIGPLVLGQPSGYNLGVHFRGSISASNFGTILKILVIILGVNLED